jgi:putative FmdB family regulatory protein
MPTYEYECTNGHTFEAVQRMSDPPLERCEKCKAKVKRLISAPSFILKGGGWYADGYSSSKSKSSDSGSSSSSSSDKKSSSGSGGGSSSSD